ncbi:replication initiation protein RepM [Acinetobacter sp.]|uniref:replication initiation protein RepM n=1 Tax=Acinetobacter sp. TaxID=472 RepID=UPI00388E5613
MKSLVVKDNALINASYNLDLVEQRLILLAIIEARESGKGINANDPLTVHAESYVSQFGVHRNTAYQALKDACNSLFARQFSYQELSEKRNIINKKSRWVSEIGYIDNEAVVQLVFAPAIVPFITRLEKNFTQYEMEQVSNLSSAYAIRLYELLIAWRSTGRTPVIELAEFRARLGVLEDEYLRSDNLKKWVIENPIQLINQHTDITVKYLQHKKGRSISGFSFTFKQKEKSNNTSSNQNISSIFHKLTEKQLDMFSSKLADLPEVQSMAHVGEDMKPFVARLRTMLMDAEQQKVLLLYLKEVGYAVA